MAALSGLVYWCWTATFTLIFRGIFRTSIIGADRVPRTGGLLVVSNHISFVDPPLMAAVLPRRVIYMAMVELFRKPMLGTLMRLIDAIPVDRLGTDRRAARLAIRRLQEGRCVVIFPEGGIRLTKQSVLGGDPEFKPGAGLIALLGGAAILPVVVRDTRKPYTWRNWVPFGRGGLRRETMTVAMGCPFCLWIPNSMPSDERRQLARQTLREQLLKTVKLV